MQRHLADEQLNTVILHELPNSIKKSWSATNMNFISFFFVKYIPMATRLGIFPRTNAYLRVQKKGPRQGELNSPWTSDKEIIEFPIVIRLFFLFIMKNHYMLSMYLTFVIILSFDVIFFLTFKLLYSLIRIIGIKLSFYSQHSLSVQNWPPNF